MASFILLLLVCGATALVSCGGSDADDMEGNLSDWANGKGGAISGDLNLTSLISAPVAGESPTVSLRTTSYFGYVDWRETEDEDALVEDEDAPVEDEGALVEDEDAPDELVEEETPEEEEVFTGPFLPNKAYTATITLTPLQNKSFSDSVTVTHSHAIASANDESYTLTKGAGGKVSGEIMFPAFFPFSGDSSLAGDSVIDLIKAKTRSYFQLSPGTEKLRLDTGDAVDISDGLVLDGDTSPTEVVIDGNGRTIGLSGPTTKALITVKTGVKLTLRNITLEVLATSTSGIPVPLISVESGGELIFETGASIKGHYAPVPPATSYFQPVVYISCNVFVSGGKFTMRDGSSISGNIATDGNVYVFNNGEFTMNGGAITRNTARSGVYIFDNEYQGHSNGKFTMTRGEISGNTGNGVSVDQGTEFTMSDGKISGNTGNGVYINGDNSEFTMNGGKISGNHGGGVSVSYHSKFTMSGGEISDHTCFSGAGVSVSSSEFIMGGGKISGNHASGDNGNGNGGGVCVMNGGSKFTMSGGTISGNTATDNGGGVSIGHVYDNSYTNIEFKMSGGVISGNTATGKGGGLYVATCFSQFIKEPAGPEDPPPASGSGFIYGSGEAGNDADGRPLENTASGGAAYYIDGDKPDVSDDTLTSDDNYPPPEEENIS